MARMQDINKVRACFIPSKLVQKACRLALRMLPDAYLCEQLPEFEAPMSSCVLTVETQHYNSHGLLQSLRGHLDIYN